jgi:DNA polymerase I-like protein with 3'-5' exonuclease and polymerase domains
MGKRIFDTQLAEYTISNQLRSYPSLNDTALSYALEGKLDIVKTDYWDKGLDTTQVPEEVLRTYLKQDVDQTWEVFCKQQPLTKPYERLLSLANQDLLSLLEIEKNGMLYDKQRSLTEGDEIQQQLVELDSRLLALVNYADFNPNSGDHISAILFGGTLTVPCRVATSRTLKDGSIKIGEKWGTQDLVFPQLVKPLKGSELKKEGFFATNEDTLKQLKPTGRAKEILTVIQERAKLEKLRGTYLHGIPKLMDIMEWEGELIHGNLNQCVTITGRLSSTKPNLQNFDGNMGYLFRSRYE